MTGRPLRRLQELAAELRGRLADVREGRRRRIGGPAVRVQWIPAEGQVSSLSSEWVAQPRICAFAALRAGVMWWSRDQTGLATDGVETAGKAASLELPAQDAPGGSEHPPYERR